MSNSTSEITIRYNNKHGPLIVHFPSGAPADSAIQANTSDSLDLSIFQHAERSRNKQIVAENEDMLYTGFTHEGSSEAISSDSLVSTSCKYLVGVFDRKKHTLELYDSALVSLKAKAKKLKRIDKYVDKEELDESARRMKNIQARNELVDMFGGRKKKQQISSAIRNRVEDAELDLVASPIQEVLDAKVVDDQTLEEVLASADEARPIPPFNANATKAEEVYSLNELLSVEEYEALKSASFALIEAKMEDIRKWRESKTYPYVILNLLSRIPIEPKKERVRKCRILQYIQYMLIFKRINESQLNGPMESLPEQFATIPNLIFKEFKNRFAERRNDERGQLVYSLTSRLRDKLLLYMFTLCLMITNYKFAYEDFMRDMKLQPLKTQEYFRALGCHIITNKEKKMVRVGKEEQEKTIEHKVAVLSIPLSFPRPRKTARK